MEAEKPPEIKPWLRRVAEAAGAWLCVLTYGAFRGRWQTEKTADLTLNRR
jgi:hypothetical protein